VLFFVRQIGKTTTCINGSSENSLFFIFFLLQHVQLWIPSTFPQVKGPVGAKMGELTKYFTKSYQESEIEVLQYLLYSIIVI
jgi:hypothetical protein